MVKMNTLCPVLKLQLVAVIVSLKLALLTWAYSAWANWTTGALVIDLCAPVG